MTTTFGFPINNFICQIIVKFYIILIKHKIRVLIPTLPTASCSPNLIRIRSEIQESRWPGRIIVVGIAHRVDCPNKA